MEQVQNIKSNNQRINIDWKRSNVAKKDLNANQWPFKIVRTMSGSKNMECRSLTDLNKSFEGTPYNLNTCDKVKSRYTLLFEAFKNRYGNITDKITHLLLTFDSLYFRTSESSEIKYFTYAKNPIEVEDAYFVINSYLYKSKYFDNIIKTDFQMYKQSNNMDYVNQLDKDIKEYIKARKHMKILDNNKSIIDVLKSELNFTSLKYLFFVPSPKNARDYRAMVKEGFRLKYNIDVSMYPNLNNEVLKIITLNDEVRGLKAFIEGLDKKEYYRSIIKVFYKDNIAELNLTTVKELFLKASASNYLEDCKYISDAEKRRISKEKEEAQKKLDKAMESEKISRIKEEEEKKKLDEKKKSIKSVIKTNYDNILNMLAIMYLIWDKNNKIFIKGQEKNDVETKIWMKEYNPDWMQQRINALYGYKHKNLDNSLPLTTILTDLNNLEDFAIPDASKWITIFDKYLVPTYFKDDRKTSKSIGCDLTSIKNSESLSVEDLQKLDVIVNQVEKKIVELFEIYLGLQYATFGAFMVRYGIGGIDIAKILVSDLTNTLNSPFVLTANVEERANEAFYLVHNNKNSFDDGFDGSKLQELEGALYGFVKKYLEKINNNGVIMKTHTDEGKSSNIELQILNLFEVAFSVEYILNFSCNKYNLNVNSQEMRNLLAEVVNKRSDN